MLGRFLGFRLDVKGSFKTYLFLVIDSHLQKFRQMFQFAFHIRIPKRGITFTAAPENVTLRTQLMRNFHGLLDLCGGVSEYLGIWARGCPMHESRMGKETGGGPKQLDSRALLLFLEDFHNGIQITVRLCQAGTFRCDISIMKGVE